MPDPAIVVYSLIAGIGAASLLVLAGVLTRAVRIGVDWAADALERARYAGAHRRVEPPAPAPLGDDLPGGLMTVYRPRSRLRWLHRVLLNQIRT